MLETIREPISMPPPAVAGAVAPADFEVEMQGASAPFRAPGFGALRAIARDAAAQDIELEGCLWDIPERRVAVHA